MLRLSPKHGVNPTVPVCFWCGGSQNVVVLLGKLGAEDGDPAAPMRMFIDYNPCEKCEGGFSLGIAFVECVEAQTQDGRPPIQTGLWPTGRLAVVRREAVERWRDEGMDIADEVLEHGRSYIHPLAWKMMGFPEEETDSRCEDA